MKIAITGATGNVGRALLRRLQADPAVSSIVGVSRHGPQCAGAPYAGVEWHRIDVADPGSGAALESAFQRVDAVIHLVWAIRPNRNRALLRATNVEGSRRVVEAAARAGVRRLVVASSVGAYGPADKRSPQGRIPPDDRHPRLALRRAEGGGRAPSRRVRGRASGDRRRTPPARPHLPGGGRTRGEGLLPR